MSEDGRIGDALLRQAAEHPDAPALEDGGRRESYASLAAAARGFAAALAGAGVAPGDRVVLHAEKRPDAVAALLGIWQAGAVAVPAHESLRARQVEHVVRDSEARLVASDARALRRLDARALAGRPVLDVAARAAPGRAPDGAGPQEAAILYTSGSTGAPKGVLLSHANLLAGTRIVAGYLGLRASDRLLGLLPFSFDYGLNQLLTALHVGATLVLQRSSHPADLCRTLREARISGLAGVPPLWAQLLSRHSPFAGERFPDLRYLTNSGGSFPLPLLARMRELLPHARIYLMYGLTEAFRSTYLDPDELDRRPDSIGRPIPETDILLVDAAGRPAPPGAATGELVHRGPTVAQGYWQKPEATARVFRPDPEAPASDRRVVFSGDQARRDAEGFLYWQGRHDALYKCHGFRVNPDEVESALLASLELDEVAVQPRPDELAGTVFVAHVVPRDPAGFDGEAFLAWGRKELPRWQAPVAVRVHAALPRTASGKIDRKALGSAP